MVKDFSTLKAALKAAQTPSVAQSARDLVGAVDRLHQSYANVYNGYSRSYVMMQELGTKEDGSVQDYTDGPRQSIAETALADKQREVRDQWSVVSGLKSYLNANPMKVGSLTLKGTAKAPLIARIVKGSGVNPLTKRNIGVYLANGPFAGSVVKTIYDWTEIFSGVYLRLNDIRTPKSIINPVDKSKLCMFGKSDCLVVPVCSWAPSSLHQSSYIGLVMLNAVYYYDDQMQPHVMVDVVKLKCRAIDSSDATTDLQSLLTGVTQTRETFHSGVISSLTGVKQSEIFFGWEITNDGETMHLKLQHVGASPIPTCTVNFSGVKADTATTHMIDAEVDGIFQDMSGVKGNLVPVDLTTIRNWIQAQMTNYKTEDNLATPIKMDYGTISAIGTSILFLVLEWCVHCNPYPLPCSGGQWDADGSEYTRSMQSEATTAIQNSGYRFMYPYGIQYLGAGDSLIPRVLTDCEQFDYTLTDAIIEKANNLLTRFPWLQSTMTMYEVSTQTGETSVSTDVTVSAGEVIYNALSYDNEQDIVNVINAL